MRPHGASKKAIPNIRFVRNSALMLQLGVFQVTVSCRPKECRNRISRVVRIAGDFDIGSHATRDEFNECSAQDEHKKCEMQRPEPAEASYHESNQIFPRRQFPCVGVCNDEATQHKKEIDE